MSTNFYQDMLDFQNEMSKHDERQKVATKPKIPSIEIQDLRFSLIREEVVKELFGALNDARMQNFGGTNEENLAIIADGIADSIVVLIGTAIAYGIPLQKVWDEVHRSNMAKLTEPCNNCDGGKYLDGQVYCPFCNNKGFAPLAVVNKRADGKILKPEGWQPPNIAKIIQEAM